MSSGAFGKIHIYIADPDEDDLTFADNNGMPILQWRDRDIEYGTSGWRVTFEELHGNGVCSEFSAGLHKDQVESAVEWARGVVGGARQLEQEGL